LQRSQVTLIVLIRCEEALTDTLFPFLAAIQGHAKFAGALKEPLPDPPQILQKSSLPRQEKFKAVVRGAILLPQLQYRLSTYRALSSTGLWRDLVNARELKIRQVCLLGFSRTMNQVKVSVPDGSHASQSLLETLTLFLAKNAQHQTLTKLPVLTIVFVIFSYILG
jgi:hypothetical protein